MITEEENMVSSRASHSFAVKQTVSLLQSFSSESPPIDYDYDYSSIFRTMKSRGYMGLYYIYLYL